MFWNSLWHGLKIFVQPSVLIPTLLFLGVEVLFLAIIRWVTDQKESEDSASTGCLTQIIGVLCQALFLGFLLLLLTPVLLGQEARASWASVAPFALVAGRAGIAAALVITVLSFIPVFGRQLAGSPGLEILIGGGLLFRLLSHPYLEGKLGKKIPPAAIYPGVWACLGYLLLAFFAGRLLMLATFPLRSRPGEPLNAFSRVWGPSLDCLVGIVVLYMYAQFVSLHLQQGL